MEENKNLENLKLENQLCFPLYATAKELVRKYRVPLDKIGLTYTQYIVMMVLWENKTISQKELGEKVYLDSGTLTPLLKRLEKQELISRKRDPNNEQIVIITLTELGTQLKEKAKSVPNEMKNCINLSKIELENLHALLNKALASIQ